VPGHEKPTTNDTSSTSSILLRDGAEPRLFSSFSIVVSTVEEQIKIAGLFSNYFLNSTRFHPNEFNTIPTSLPVDPRPTRCLLSGSQRRPEAAHWCSLDHNVSSQCGKGGCLGIGDPTTTD